MKVWIDSLIIAARLHGQVSALALIYPEQSGLQKLEKEMYNAVEEMKSIILESKEQGKNNDNQI
jgi:hypothetical protein